MSVSSSKPSPKSQAGHPAVHARIATQKHCKRTVKASLRSRPKCGSSAMCDTKGYPSRWPHRYRSSKNRWLPSPR
eukprot:1667273-Rhodomonas_salina.2